MGKVVKEESKAVAIKEAASVPMESQLAAMMEEDSGVGFENGTAADYAIPFLRVIQKGSPECDEASPEYDETMRPGMFQNSVTGKRYDGKKGVLFVPAMYLRVGTKWASNKADGTGFRGQISAADLDRVLLTCERDEKGHDILPDGLMLVDNRQWFGLTLDDEEVSPVLFSLKATQIKKSKKWYAFANGLRHNGKPTPLYSQVYRITTVPEKNDQGGWMGVTITHEGTVPNVEVALEAKNFRGMILSGTAKPVEPDIEESTGAEPFNNQF